MTANTNTCEALQPAGTAVTTSNSGGSAGRAFDNVTGTVTYDTTHTHTGAEALKVDMAGGTTSQVRWIDGADQATPDSWVRAYFYFTAFPGATTNLIYVTNSGNSFLARGRIRADGTLDMVDSTGAILATTTAAIALGQWIRIEMHVTAGATGTCELWLYTSPDDVTATEHISATGNMNTLYPGQWRIGGNTSSASSDVFWVDDIATSDTAQVGPRRVAGTWTQNPNTIDAEVLTYPTPGNWLLALYVCRTSDGTLPTLNVGDLSRNMWSLLTTETIEAHGEHAGAALQAEIWACPAVAYEGWPFEAVYAQVSLYSDIGATCVSIIEVPMVNGYLSVDSVTVASASAANSLALTAPAPTGGENCLMVAAAAGDISYGSYTTTGTGWTQLPNVTSAAGPELGLFSAWREATTGGSVTFALDAGFFCNWAGVLVSIRTTGTAPAQPNPNWPATQFQVGLGYDLATPLPRVHWTDQTSRFLSLASDGRGIQAERGLPQQSATDITLDNRDAAYSPRTAGSATATANGTTTTLLIPQATITTAGATVNANPSFETDLSGWSPQGATLTRVTDTAYPGAVASMQITPDGVTSAGGAIDALSGAGTVVAGVDYVASMWAYSPGGWSDTRVAVDWYDASGVMLSTSFGTQVALPAGAWTYLSDMFTAPASASQARMRVRHGGTPSAADFWYVWAVQLTLQAAIRSGDIHVGDFFRLRDSGGDLKQFGVFQVASLSSAAGTTTITFTRADGTGGALAATAASDQYEGVPVDLYTPYRLLGTIDGRTYVAASGWMRDNQTVYVDASTAYAQIVSADAWETLSADDPSILAGEILRRSPTHYWPLADAAGSGAAANASGVSAAQLLQTRSKYGAGAATTADFGASTQDVDLGFGDGETASILGDPGTGWAQDGQTSAEIRRQGYALVGQGIPDLPPISGGVTIAGVLITTSAQATTIDGATADPTLVMARDADPGAGVGQGSIIKVSIDRATGQARITWWDKGTHATTTAVCSSAALISGQHAWALVFDQTSWAMYVDGILAGSGSCNLVANWTGIDVGGEADQFFHGLTIPGTHAHIAVFGRRLTEFEAGDLSWAAATGMLGEAAYGLIRRKLDVTGWPGGRVLLHDSVEVGPEASPSGSIADVIADVAAYGDGLVFPDAASQLQYRSRIGAGRQTVRAVLGEDVAAGEIPYQPGVSPAYSPAYLYNAVSITNTRKPGNARGGTATTTFVAVDETSARKRGQRGMTPSTRFNDDGSAWDMAWWYLARYATPQQRVETVTIEAAAAPERWAFVLSVEVGDLVTVMKRHLGRPTISLRCRVLRVAPRIVYGSGGEVSGSVTLTLAAAPPVITILADPAYGIAGDTVMGA